MQTMQFAVVTVQSVFFINRLKMATNCKIQTYHINDLHLFSDEK